MRVSFARRRRPHLGHDTREPSRRHRLAHGAGG